MHHQGHAHSSLHQTLKSTLLWMLFLSLQPSNVAAALVLPVGATMQSDIAYGSDPRQRLDVYRPAVSSELAPIIFMVHGGAWKLGDKAESNVVDNKVLRWVAKGFVFVSVNYRMLPEADPLQQAGDVARALAYVQQHATDYQGDPGRVILMGHSAGAHLVSLISTDPTLATSQGVAPWLGTVSLDSAALDAVYIMEHPHLPLYDEAFGTDPAFWAATSPFHVIVQPVPPFLAVCSSFRPESLLQAARFDARGVQIGTPVAVLAKDLTHEEINATLGIPGAYTDEVESFLGTLDPVVAAMLGLAPPVITGQPVSMATTTGNGAAFTVTGVGAGPLTYQWHKNNGAIAGATGSSLTIGITTEADAGSYTVVVTNAAGSVISNAAVLTVNSAINPDFNGDGKSDILWTNTATGDRAIWFMNGTAVSTNAFAGTVPVSWAVSGTGDFDGNGKADILWTNTATGDRAMWLMNGSAISSGAYLGVVPVAWTVSGTGDFNGDGKTDIVWTNTATGERSIWLMNGGVLSAGGSLGVVPVAWAISGTGDFDDDGKTDILLSSTVTGDRVIWFMNGTAISTNAFAGTVPVSWLVGGVGDFDGDGKADIFWTNTSTGDRAVWLMNGSTLSTGGYVGAVPVEWVVSLTGDYNGDGKADVLWTNTATGERAMWLMNGIASNGGASLGVVPVEWVPAD